VAAEDAPVCIEDGVFPELRLVLEVELELPDVSDVHRVFFLHLAVRVFIDLEVVFLVDIYFGVLE
jgi:hypothetical protein